MRKNAGAYAAFSAGEGVQFKLELSLCIIRKVHPFQVEKENCFCIIKINYVALY